MAVSGFLGRGLVNSFVKGDGSTGTLTSPPFAIERPYLNFLIGGGGHPGTTCLDLMIEGKVVRTATGPNDRPGGTEQLDWSAWDVQDLIGQTAVLRIVDHETGGWGHINVDQIVQSDGAQGVVPAQPRDDRRARVIFTCPFARTRRCAGFVSAAGGGSSASSTSSSPRASPSSRSFSTFKPLEGKDAHP